jgi:SAM-dependent methyltransferase
MPDALFPSDQLFTIVECQSCGLGFVNPRPSRAEMQRFYPAEYYRGFERDGRYHQARYGLEAQYLASIESDGVVRRLLDIGCAHGGFPRFMRTRGWEVEGVEVSSTSEPITDFPVYRQDFADAQIGSACYDAVTAWAVMEHVHDPAAYFRKVASVLRPGGIFVFLVTNFDSLASRHLFGEDVPRHLYFFTESSVRRYVGQVGLTLERADYSNEIFAMPATNWLRFLLKQLQGRDFKWEDRRSASAFNRAHDLRPGLTSALRFYARFPLTLFDHAMIPFLDRYQIWRRSYAIVTYVARRT